MLTPAPGNASARTPTSAWLGTLLVSLFIVSLFIYFRKPGYVIRPDFCRDEWRLVFRYAYLEPALEALISPRQGYYSLFNNTVAFISALFVSEAGAKFINVYASFVAQLVPYAIIWAGRSTFWPATSHKVLASALVLFVSPDCTLWLTVACSQFYFCLACMLILLEDWEGRSERCRRIYAALLVLFCLTGVVSCLLAPFFMYRAYRERTAFARSLANVVMVSCALQIVAVLWFSAYGTMVGNAHRFKNLNPLHSLELLLSRSFSVTLLGTAIGSKSLHISAREVRYLMIVLPLFWFYVVRPLPAQEKLILVGGFTIVSLVSAFTSIYSAAAARYFYMPNITLAIMMWRSLQLAGTQNLEVRHLVCAFFLFLTLYFGIDAFYHSTECWKSTCHLN